MTLARALLTVGVFVAIVNLAPILALVSGFLWQRRRDRAEMARMEFHE